MKTEELVAFGCHDRNLWGLDLNQGTLRWRCSFEGPVYATPFRLEGLSGGNYIVSCCTQGRLRVVRAADGSSACSFSLPGQIFSSPVCAWQNGQLWVYVGCRDDYLHCLNIELATQCK